MLQHAGLDDALLGPRLARLLAANSPLPAREMVARGLAPLAGSEAWLALYQLWVRGGPTLAEHASRTAGELPAAAVMTALADPHLPPVVLDFMARRRIRSPETLRLIVHHPRVHDATLAALARCAPEAVCSAIAKNQRRWLACPAIAEQLVRNPCCDRSTVHAVLELGARESIEGLAELRRGALAGATLHDDPAAHARATAWILRSGPADGFPDLTAANLALRPGSGVAHPDMSLRAGSREAAVRDADLALRTGPRRSPRDRSPASEPEPPEMLLSFRPGPGPSAGDLLADAAPALPGRRVSESLDEQDELDLPIGDDWDEESAGADVPPPAPRGAVPLPELALPPARPAEPRQLELPRSSAPAPVPTPGRSEPPRPRPTLRYRDSVRLVLDPGTPLPLAMSLLHRLRAPDLRRVVATRRLAPALVAAARRRTGAA